MGPCSEQVIDQKCIINVHDSQDDKRVSADHDNLDFLNVFWDTGDASLIRSPGFERYGGKLSVRNALHAQSSEHRVRWKNALIVPMLNEEAEVVTLVLAINKHVSKGLVFQQGDTGLVKTLVMIAGLETNVKRNQEHLASALSVRRSIITEMGEVISKSSQTLTSTEMFVKDVLSNMLKITKAGYGAVYIKNSRTASFCIKYDSRGTVFNEKRNKSLSWSVLDTGSPFNIASATDIEASQTIPSTPFGSLRSILGEPLIIDNEIQGVLLVAWKSSGVAFDLQDEQALHDFGVLFGATYKLLHGVETLVTAVEMELAIPRHSIPALSSTISATGEKKDTPSSPGNKRM